MPLAALILPTATGHAEVDRALGPGGVYAFEAEPGGTTVTAVKQGSPTTPPPSPTDRLGLTRQDWIDITWHLEELQRAFERAKRKPVSTVIGQLYTADAIRRRDQKGP